MQTPFAPVFERLNPKQLEYCFEQWVNQLVQDHWVEVIAIDGKNLKGSYDRQSGSKALHFVSAWASEHPLVLAQTKVQDKSNEITAIPAWLELLNIQGCIVTLDAMGTQKNIAAQIQQARADYIICLKANHPTLFKQLERFLKTARDEDTLPRPKSTHHRSRTSSP